MEIRRKAYEPGLAAVGLFGIWLSPGFPSRGGIALQLTVRPISPAEATEFLDVMLRCWRGTVAETSTAYRETPETLAKALSGDGYGVLLERKGQPVGCGRTVTVPGPAPDHISRKWVEIKRVGVLPDARGLGFAARILGALETEARSRNAQGGQLAVRSDQPRLVDFWRRLGYATADDVILTTPNPLAPPPVHMRKWFAPA